MSSLSEPLRRLARRHLTLKQRSLLALLRVRLRRPTARLRSLPDFLILGAQRSGTSSLYRYLGRHPRIVPSLRKEVDYFSTRYAEGESWYRAHFPLALGRRDRTFEASVDYLLHPLAAERAADLIPEARLIALVRDPVERAWSHWRHMVRHGLEDLSFAEALEREDERLEGEMERIAREPDYPAKPLRRYSYRLRGQYARHLKPWLHHFPRHQLLVLTAEELFADPAATCQRVLDFLGLPADPHATYPNYSYVRRPAEREAIPSNVARRLAADFAGEAERLHELVGLDVDW